MARPTLSKDTQLFVSIAQHPSNFGTTLFNAAFGHEGIDAVYKALAVSPGDLRDAVAGIRALGIAGCGVSMPFKAEVLRYLDAIDVRAKRIGAVNTIVCTKRRLKGYNTDYVGAYRVLSQIQRLAAKPVLLLGAGGVAQAISAALRSLRARQVYVASRDAAEGRALVRKWGFQAYIPWPDRQSVEAQVLINATPVGMAPQVQGCPIDIKTIAKYEFVMDVVINPLETKLIKAARRHGRQVISGHAMSLHQAAAQSELYTGRGAPVHVMERVLKRYILSTL